MGVRRNVERKVPTREQKVKALFELDTFANLIYFHGGMRNFGWVHKDIIKAIESNWNTEPTRELFLLPRGHLKTTICTVLSALHDIYVNPNVRIYIGSANQSLAKAICREIVANLVDPWLKENIWDNRPHFEGRLIPLMDRGTNSRRVIKRAEDGQFSEFQEDELDDKKVIWRQEAIQVIRPYRLKEPTVTIGSVESPATGFHYDKIYFDDIINFNNYDTPEKVERLDIWRNDMFSVLDDVYHDGDLEIRLNKAQDGVSFRKSKSAARTMAHVGGFVRVVGTRYFKHDWYKQLIDEEDEKFKYYNFVKNIYENGRNSDDGYIWKEVWTKETEQRKKKEMSSKHFAAQYLNKVIVEENQTLPFDKIKWIHPDKWKFKKQGSSTIIISNPDYSDRNLEVSLKLAIDPAATCNKDSDYTAIAVGGKDRYGNLYIVDIKLLKVTSAKWIQEMYRLIDKWNLSAVTLETVAFAAELKSTIRYSFDKYKPIAIRDYKPSNKSSKKERIESGLEPLLVNGMFYMAVYCAGLEDLKDQFNYFPAETEHDDGLDVIQMLNEVCHKTAYTNNVVKMREPINSKWGGYR